MSAGRCGAVYYTDEYECSITEGAYVLCPDSKKVCRGIRRGPMLNMLGEVWG